jgi:hypothetical protein
MGAVILLVRPQLEVSYASEGNSNRGSGTSRQDNEKVSNRLSRLTYHYGVKPIKPFDYFLLIHTSIMVRKTKPIDQHFDKIFIEARRFTPAVSSKFRFEHHTPAERNDRAFTNHDLNHIALFNKKVRRECCMYSSEGLLNVEGACVLFRRKESSRQYINDPSTLNDNVDNGGRVLVRSPYPRKGRNLPFPRYHRIITSMPWILVFPLSLAAPPSLAAPAWRLPLCSLTLAVPSE